MFFKPQRHRAKIRWRLIKRVKDVDHLPLGHISFSGSVFMMGNQWNMTCVKCKICSWKKRDDSETHFLAVNLLSTKSAQISEQNYQRCAKSQTLVGGFNPFEKYSRQIGSFPQVGVKLKHIWNHHLDYQRCAKSQLPSSKRVNLKTPRSISNEMIWEAPAVPSLPRWRPGTSDLWNPRPTKIHGLEIKGKSL